MSVTYEQLLDFQLGPIREWPGRLTAESYRRRAQFSATFTDTKRLLSRELFNLGAEAILVQIAMRDEDFRIDGLPRARAVALHPGVVVSFNPDGIAAERMQFATDVFHTWQDNLRAIALGLEALRKVDRYGITNGRQQYAGFKALPKGDDDSMGLYTAADATEFIRRFLGLERTPVDMKSAARVALKRAHPDTGGDEEQLRTVVRARELLGL